MKVTTYEEFAALPNAVRERVLEQNCDWNVEHGEWWDYVYEYFKEQMQSKGITVDNIQFSGFWSQGDGASFDGDIHDLELFVTSHGLTQFKELVKHEKSETCDLSIIASWNSWGSYSHANSLKFYFDNGLTEPDERDYSSPLLYQVHLQLFKDLMIAIDEFEQEVDTVITDHCHDLYKSLEEEYDHLTSEEAVIESMLCNDALQEAVDDAVDYLGLNEEENV